MTAYRLGYARISTAEQNLDLQRDALQQAGCDQVFADVASGAKRDRPQLAALLSQARAGDTVVVWRIDRLGRSLRHLLETVTALDEQGVALVSLSEGIDTATPTGKLMLHLMGSMAEWERTLIRERATAGRAAARARGRQGGRQAVMTPSKLEAARALLAADHSPAEVAKTLGVGRSTLYRALAGA
jgi:DNA invertase Pin-like site-specific DNA recombinase